MKIGDLVRTKSPFEPEICLVVGVRKAHAVGDECYEVLASNTVFKTYKLRKNSLEVINESR